MAEIEPLPIAGAFLVTPFRHRDHRGWFAETWNPRTLAAAGIAVEFVQDNMSFSRSAGTIRGLHLQVAPLAQAKLVQVLAGEVFDVVVDLRPASPTFGRWTGVDLDAESGRQVYVPDGCAHGFMTLVPETRVFYKVTRHHSPLHERVVRFDDPAIGIDWPALGVPLVISDRDRHAPLLRDARLEAAGP